jgi:hypothetical protein
MGQVVERLVREGYVFLTTAEASAALEFDFQPLEELCDAWTRLPRDAYLRDGGRYRSRRHSCFVQDLPSDGLSPVARRAHWQPTAYNALHGGLERWFEPIEADVLVAPAWTRLLTAIGSLFATAARERGQSVERWFIEAHQFRIDTESGIGRPTPEGAHRDGVDFVALVLIERRGILGGETRVFDAHGPSGVRFTMTEPWSMLLMDDERVIHETTPIQPSGTPGYRDTLVLTYRAGGFQAPDR